MVLQFGRGGEQKINNHARVLFHVFGATPPLERSLWILACWVISPTWLLRFCVNQFRSFGVLMFTIFSERTTLSSLYAISRLSNVCCLSVCDVGAPYSGGW